MPEPLLPSEFPRFLRAAKSATYAGQGDEASVAPVLLDSKQLEYREGALFYRDIYVGMFRFVGQEIVYLSDRAIWSMSYGGGLAEGVAPESAGAIYALLRRALLGAPLDLPLRGPARFETEGMVYTCRCEGSLDRFYGSETIACDGVKRYELHFSGGSLS